MPVSTTHNLSTPPPFSVKLFFNKQMWSRLNNGHLNLLFFLLYQYKLKENTQDDSLLLRRVPSTPHGENENSIVQITTREGVSQ